MKRSGFTILELLVVVLIIAILVAVLFPVLASVKKASHQSVSLNNMRQLGVARLIYIDNNNSKFMADTIPLVVAKTGLKSVTARPGDPFTRGTGNQLREILAHQDRVVSYTDSYVTLLDCVGPAYADKFVETEGGGWLVDFTQGQWNKEEISFPLPIGRYHRLLFDNSVQTRLGTYQKTLNEETVSVIPSDWFADANPLPNKPN